MKVQMLEILVGSEYLNRQMTEVLLSLAPKGGAL